MRADTWRTYVQKTKDRKVRRLLVEALPYVHKYDEALDLGAGALNESRYLLEQGFKHVTAVDLELFAQDIAASFSTGRFTYQKASFDTFDFPENRFDIVNAQYSLQFYSQQNFESLFRKVKQSLVTGGLFVGQLFGDRDAWKDASNIEVNVHDEEDARNLIGNMEIIKFLEVEKDEPSVTRGEIKHWHYFDIIARAK